MAENNVHLFANVTKLYRSRHSESTLESTQKQSYLKGIFMVRRWIDNKMVINFGTVVKARALNTYHCLALV